MNKFDLDTLRHSTAHVMAQAIKELFPNENVKFGVGPTLEYGFYYDVDLSTHLSETDLKNIENKMKEIIKEKLKVTRHEVSRSEAISLFSKENQNLKIELINELPENEIISYYSHGDNRFIDLCRGPHIEHTGELPTHFKLLHTAGAYWKGDQEKQVLQRVYAACFESKEELNNYLHFIEEAKKRDHRKLGVDLQLFHFDKVAPASPFIMPKGTHIYNELVSFIRRLYSHYNYSEVITPQVLDVELWHTSGHYENYKENMYFTHVDNREFALKPMNCPCHMMMFKHYSYSYRDLPMRFADFGRLHRYEKSGVTAGMTRVRTFCQDDAHIFVPMELIQDEIKSLMEMFFICYKHFGFTDVKINLSTRPEKKIGSDEVWDSAENALKQALETSGHTYLIKEGDGAFYGPKIDIEIADALKRYHQLGTIQLDFMLPERFDLSFTNKEGNKERPVVIHRALLGSLERFIGVYIEHVAGAFPFWLAPEQIHIVPVRNENHLEYAQKIEALLKKNHLKVKVDDRNESMGKKTREIQKNKIPFMIVIGDQEMTNNTLTLRKYGETESKTVALNEALQIFSDLAQEKVPAELRDLL